MAIRYESLVRKPDPQTPNEYHYNLFNYNYTTNWSKEVTVLTITNIISFNPAMTFRYFNMMKLVSLSSDYNIEDHIYKYTHTRT